MSKRKSILIIGPTAVGKSTLLTQALKDFPDELREIITYTTRSPRAGESEGDPYHFVTEEKFRELLAKNFFIEHAVVHGLLYGTPRDQVDLTHQANKTVIMDIDVQGAKKFREAYPEAVTVFILPPSIDVLRQRFRARGATDEADLERRIESAHRELAQAEDFDYRIVNNDFQSAYAELRKIIEDLLKNQ